MERTLGEVSRNPLLFALAYRDRRRALLNIFPYQVIYVVQSDIIVVLSITHSSRNPMQWQDRLLPGEREQ